MKVFNKSLFFALLSLFALENVQANDVILASIMQFNNTYGVKTSCEPSEYAKNIKVPTDELFKGMRVINCFIRKDCDDDYVHEAHQIGFTTYVGMEQAGESWCDVDLKSDMARKIRKNIYDIEISKAIDGIDQNTKRLRQFLLGSGK